MEILDDTQMFFQQQQEHQQWIEQAEADFQKWKNEYETKFDSNNKFYIEENYLYAEYIMEHCGGSRVICNGDTLLSAQEDGYLWDDFVSKQYEESQRIAESVHPVDATQ